MQPGFQLRLVSLAQGQFQAGKFFAHELRQFGQVIAQDGARGAKAQLLRRAAAQIIGQRLQPFKERLDETKQFFAGAGQGKRPPIEQGDSQGFLELDDLGADGRLLDAVRDVAHRLADAPVPADVVEQLQMVNVHVSKGLAADCSSC